MMPVSQEVEIQGFRTEGNVYELQEVDWEHDWAWVQTKYKGKLSPSYSTSTRLDISNKLHILGYPYSLGVWQAG